MNLAVLKGILALAATATLLAGSTILYQRRRTLGSFLPLLGAACFVVVALAHVCEALAILSAFGWGQPRSIGHYIDLGAMVLGVTFVSAGLALEYGHRARRLPRT
jgi:hypothetical protein